MITKYIFPPRLFWALHALCDLNFKRSVLAAIVLLVACSSSANQLTPIKSNDTTGFDANDVSILLPLKKGLPYPAISLASSQWRLLEENIFEQVLKFEYNQSELKDLPYIHSQFLTNIARWYLTSIRYDDCGDQFQREELVDSVNNTKIIKLFRVQKCQPRLRLVAQPFNYSGQPLPSALHLLFNLNAHEQSEIYKALFNIKNQSNRLVSTNGQPLQVHPGLLKEITVKPEQHEVHDATLDLIRILNSDDRPAVERLEILTLTIGVDTLHWQMVGGYVEGGVWRRFVTDYNQKFYDKSGSEKILLGVEDIKCNFYEWCATLPKSVEQNFEQDNLLTPALTARKDGLFQAPIKNTVTELTAEMIEDVRSTHFFNTNCISCHVSTSFRNREKLLTDQEYPKGISPFTLKNLMSSRSSTIFNFAYEGLSPIVSVRTANESGIVADRVNQVLGLKNPAPTIFDFSAFWKCLMQNSDLNSCFEK